MSLALTALPPARSAWPLPAPGAAPIADARALRSVLRGVLAPFQRPHDTQALAIVALDLGLWCAAFVASALVTDPAADAALAVILAVLLFRLSALGHDASHGALVTGTSRNRWIARLVHAPSHVVEVQWDFTHNVHHGFTNHAGADFLWRPLSPGQYRALGPARRWLERALRGPLGHGAYFLLRVWWPALCLLAPSGAMVAGPRRTLDRALVGGLLVAQLTLLAAVSDTPGAWGLAVLWAVIAPQILWAWMAGLVSHIQHTAPDIPWHGSPQPAPGDAPPHPASTVIAGLEHTRVVALPGWLAWLLHQPMEHVTHHLSVRIPFYRARAARLAVMAALPGMVRVERYTFATLARTCRICQLYDPRTGRWVRFADVA